MGPDDRDWHAALAASSRRRLLAELRSAPGALDVAALAASTDLHVTTARFHLDVLERAGLVRRDVERAGKPGRPRQVYAAVLAPDPGEGHRQLASVLAGALATEPDATSSRQWAQRAGRRWAATLIQPVHDGSWDQSTRQVGTLFERLGFAPQLTDGPEQRHLELHACPFRDVARTHPDVVCTVHLGLLRGALARLGDETAAESAKLRPFVEAELCVADLPVPASEEQQ